MAAVMPQSQLAETHRKMAEPGSASDEGQTYQKPLG